MKHYQRVGKICAWLMCLIGLTGCASNAAVKCDGRLYPINAPVPLSGMGTQDAER